MVDIKAFPYLCFVRFDLVHKEFDREFNIHFDDHIQELADRPGYSTAWRTRELRGGPFHDSEGVIEQEYQQIYAIEDPGLTVFPTHRLVRGLEPQRQEALAAAIREDFEIEEITRDQLEPPSGGGPLELGYIDSHFRQPFRLTLKY